MQRRKSFFRSDRLTSDQFVLSLFGAHQSSWCAIFPFWCVYLPFLVRDNFCDPDSFSLHHFQADAVPAHIVFWKGGRLQTGCSPSSVSASDSMLPPSFVSRVTNEHVLRQANCAKFSGHCNLPQRQLQLLGRSVQLPPRDVMPCVCVFRDASFQLKLSGCDRRHTWATEMCKHALDAAVSIDNLTTMWQQPSFFHGGTASTQSSHGTRTACKERWRPR